VLLLFDILLTAVCHVNIDKTSYRQDWENSTSCGNIFSIRFFLYLYCICTRKTDPDLSWYYLD